MLEVVRGDLLNATEDYICQQCNCISVRPHGLSQQIALKYPHVDPYSSRRPLGNRNLAVPEDRPVPGSIHVYGSDQVRKVICMFAQYGMGKPGAYGNTEPDSHTDRLRWFIQCLGQITMVRPKSIALPWMIGCGLAGGDWSVYHNILGRWAVGNPEITVRLYRL